ncbi:MAG: heme-binding protein [Chloroflexi bacterium]|nr:heme-binding protein [Chloroflexota bacterium]
MSLTLEEAKRIADGAVAKAKELKIRISVSVCDDGGQTVVLHRMDGANWAANYGCQGKAAAASAFGVPGSTLAERAQSPEGDIEFEGVRAAEGRHLNFGPGSVPVYHGGVLIGGCGVGGGTGTQDEECARAGVARFKG